MNKKLFWFYHKETNEPLQDHPYYDFRIGYNGLVYGYQETNHNDSVDVLTPDHFKDYELRFHRKNIKMSGPSLETMLKECIPNDCVEDSTVGCIWDEWKL